MTSTDAHGDEAAGPEGVPQFVAVSLDCDDPAALAEFYVAMLAGELLWSSPSGAGVRVPGLTLVCQRVDGYQAPRWPGSSLVHLDLSAGPTVAATTAAVERAITWGAQRATHQPDSRWTVLLDPAGHPFCITQVTPPG
jgi:Glyoxalase-like domain